MPGNTCWLSEIELPQVYQTGQYEPQIGGYRAFIPAPPPSGRQFLIDHTLHTQISRADRALARLDGSIEALPAPDLFVLQYIRKEAVLSSQIEGTQASLSDVLKAEAKVLDPALQADIGETVNNIAALRYGVEQIASRPLTTNLICEMHIILMRDVRGGDRRPGELRDGQNWIGPEGSHLTDATFVPPPPGSLADQMAQFERFVNEDQELPLLVKIAFSHAYFETIHPFFDGNGRLGRTIITLLLQMHGALTKPVLYISHYLRRHRGRYNDRLQATREDGDLTAWVEFFLDGVIEVAEDATRVSRAIINLREMHRQAIVETMNKGAANGLKALESLYKTPVTTTNNLARLLGVSYQGAAQIVSRLVELGVLTEITGRSRDRLFLYEGYFRLFAPDDLIRT